MRRNKYIHSTDHACRTCILVHKDSGEPVVHGSIHTSSKGERYKVLGGAAPHKSSSTGRVFTRALLGGYSGTFFPGILGMVWRPVGVTAEVV